MHLRRSLRHTRLRLLGQALLLLVGACGGEGLRHTVPRADSGLPSPTDAALERGPAVPDVPEFLDVHAPPDVPTADDGPFPDLPTVADRPGPDLPTVSDVPAAADLPAPTPVDVGPADIRAEAPELGGRDSIAVDGAVSCTMYPDTSRVDGNGKTLYWWRFDWQQDDLASFCASYGTDAKMVIEYALGMPTTTGNLPTCTNAETMGYGDHVCAMLSMTRLEVDCTLGFVLFEGTQYPDWLFVSGPGYYHVESARYPVLARRLMIADKACDRLLHPRFIPMAPAGSPEIGIDTAGSAWIDDYDPSQNGQPCQADSPCPSGSTCLIDAPVSDCQIAPVGHCVPSRGGNTCQLNQTCWACLMLFGTTCSAFPGYACGRTNCGYACAPLADAGLDAS